MTHKKKQQFVAPAIRVVKMHSECTIMAASEGPAPASITTEKVTEGGSINWSTGGLKN